MGEEHKTRIFIVSHTHWDREWYKTVEETRFRLLELAERLVHIYATEHNRAPFWLDGQCVIIEDLFEIADDRLRMQFTGLLKSRKVLIGPWYTLSDELLVSGESQIRNLLLGREIMCNYGQDNRVGYLPDTFGHISQMPQILSGFGINNAIFWRGYTESDLPQLEMRWISPNRQEVFTSCLLLAYNPASGICVDNISQRKKKLLENIKKLDEKSRSGVILMQNGSDQALPPYNIEALLVELQTEQRNYEWTCGTIEDYLKEVKARGTYASAPIFDGELLHRPQMDGTLSSRGSLKRLNRMVENLLIFYTEPLEALSQVMGYPNQNNFVKHAWKLLLQNHAHDSICGCHSDAVYQDILTRFRQVEQIGRTVCQRALHNIICQHPHRQEVSMDSYIVFYNPTQWDWHDVVEIEVVFPAGQTAQRVQFTNNGQELPSHLISEDTLNRIVEAELAKWDIVEFGIQRKKFVVMLDIPGTGFTIVDIHPSAVGQVNIFEPDDKLPQVTSDTSHTRSIGCPPDTLDNELIRVVVHPDGHFDLQDIETGTSYYHLNVIADYEELGDLYESCLPISFSSTSPSPGTLKLIENGPLAATILVDTSIICTNIRCPLEVYVTLCRGQKRVNVRTRVCNNSFRHALKASFHIDGPFNLKTHMPFDIVSRTPQSNQLYQDAGRWRRLNSPLQPMQYFLMAERCGGSSLYVANRGIYEFFWNGEECIQVTLLRSVDKIRENLSSLNAADGREPGWNTFEYCVGIAENLESTIQSAFQYNLPPFWTQSFREKPKLLPATLSFSNPKWILSSIKSAEHCKGIVIRFWNSSEREEIGEIKVTFGFFKAYLARLDESFDKEFRQPLIVPPKTIITVVFEQEIEHDQH